MRLLSFLFLGSLVFANPSPSLASNLSSNLSAPQKKQSDNSRRTKLSRPTIAMPSKDLQSYELRVSTDSKWLVLEKLKLGTSPTYFLKLRKGRRTTEVTVIPKSLFDRWTQDLRAVGKSERRPSCSIPFEIISQVNGRKTISRFCPAATNDPIQRQLSKSADEMLAYVNKNDALRARGRTR